MKGNTIFFNLIEIIFDYNLFDTHGLNQAQFSPKLLFYK